MKLHTVFLFEYRNFYLNPREDKLFSKEFNLN